MRRRIVALLALTAALVAAPALSATAADLDPTLVYRGPATTNSVDGSTEFTLTLTIDCGEDPCRVQATADAGDEHRDFSPDGGYALEDGRASVHQDPSGDPCDDASYFPGGDYVFDIGAASARMTASFTGSGEIDCSDGSSIEWLAATFDATIPYVSGSVCLLDSSCGEEPVATPIAVPAPVASPDDPRHADDPSVFGELPGIQRVTVRDVVWATAGSLVLVLLLALPTALLDSVADRVSAAAERWGARRPTLRRLPSTLSGWLPALVGLAIAGVVSAFVDPRVGPDLAGLRTVATVLLSFAVAIALGWLVVSLVARRTHPGSATRLELRPATLLIVLGAVLFSRLTGFEPGLVFGLVAGVVLGGALASAPRARFALLGLGWSFGIGVLAWIGYSLLPGADDGVLFLRETLAAIAVTGLAALPIALLPLRGFVGHDLWSWRKPAWGIAYGLGAFAFLLVLLRAPFAWGEVDASVWAWSGLVAAYAVAAVIVWLVVARPWRRGAADEPSAS